MHHGLYIVLLERVYQLVNIPNVGFDKGKSVELAQYLGCPPVAPAVVVDPDDLFPIISNTHVNLYSQHFR